MTSPARGGPDSAGMREALLPIVSAAMRSTENTEWLMDRLLPVVQGLAAEELRAAQRRATTRDYMTARVRLGAQLVADDLGAHADALAAAAQPTDGRTGE